MRHHDISDGTVPAIKHSLFRIHKRDLCGRQADRCQHCVTLTSFRMMEVDHIVLRKQGGIDTLDNLQLLRGPCNRPPTCTTGTEQRP